MVDTGKLSKSVKFLVEVDVGAFYEEPWRDSDTVHGFLLWYGLRFHNRSLAMNVGLVTPVVIADGIETSEIPSVLPGLSLMYRYVP